MLKYFCENSEKIILQNWLFDKIFQLIFFSHFRNPPFRDHLCILIHFNILLNIQFRPKTRNGQKSVRFYLISIFFLNYQLELYYCIVFNISHDEIQLKSYLWHKLEHKDYKKGLNFAHRFFKLKKSYFCIENP